MRAVVVGASSGLGRSIGIGLARRGAHVALLARRHDRLVDAAKEAGEGALAIRCDVTDPVVYASGVGPLGRLTDIDVATWHHAFDTNVIGANLITTAALPHLKESGGTVAYLSSISAWRVEQPTVGFTRVVVGDCNGGEGESGTEFPNAWDTELATELGTMWFTSGLITGTLLAVDELVRVIDSVLRSDSGTSIPSIVVTPRPAG